MNAFARTLALTLGAVLVTAISGCAFSGPGTHPGGDGFHDVGGGSEKASPPEPEDPGPPVPR